MCPHFCTVPYLRGRFILEKCGPKNNPRFEAKLYRQHARRAVDQEKWTWSHIHGPNDRRLGYLRLSFFYAGEIIFWSFRAMLSKGILWRERIASPTRRVQEKDASGQRIGVKAQQYYQQIQPLTCPNSTFYLYLLSSYILSIFMQMGWKICYRYQTVSKTDKIAPMNANTVTTAMKPSLR